jgi:curved DNA-binding protein CbpA
MTTTHYDLLGLSVDATPEEIREARRRLLSVSHPDRATDGSDRERRETISAALSAAAATLLDVRTRRVYDRRIGVTHRFTPNLPPEARRAVSGALAPLLHTRIGQWSLIVLVALLLGVIGTPSLLAGFAIAALAYLLSRPGEPTPLRDLERLLTALLRVIRGPGAEIGRRAVSAAEASLRERVAEAGLSGQEPRGGLPRRPPPTAPGSGGGPKRSDGAND